MNPRCRHQTYGLCAFAPRSGLASAPQSRPARPRTATKLRAAFLCAALFCTAQTAFAAPPPQEEGERTRNLWDTAFGRPERRTRRVRKAKRRHYRVTTPGVSPADVAADTVIGVTLWRLRPARRMDTGVRLFEHRKARDAAWIPERVSANTRFSEGDRVRVSVEAARTGYLYVIDREQYADGTLGDPYLIFPTTRINGGNNQVKAGRLIDIPAQGDEPPYFTLKRSRPNQVGELLSVIITTAPLDGVQILDQDQKLTGEQVALWERAWGQQVGQLELEGGAGQAWTGEEKEAGAVATRSLKRDAPTPQTLYYSPAAKSDAPLLIRVHLKYGRS